MRLSDFILENLELILQAWEKFARSVAPPLPPLDSVGLRNHAECILRHVALDMRTSQNSQQQIDPSQRLGSTAKEDSAAQSFALTRLMEGLTLDQMVSEYLALKSSVLGLWLAQAGAEEDDQVVDIIRFNEGIDQALVASIATYELAAETARKTVLGVLGHDLRTPLGAVTLGTDLLKQTEELSSRGKKIISQISVSAQHANQMVNDLLDLARCNLGKGIPVRPVNTDLTSVCKSVVDELTLAHPKAHIVFNNTGSVIGHYDPSRMAQVFSNLIGNAVRHGSSRHSVNVTLNSVGTSARFCVQNHGELIPHSALPTLFNLEGRYSRHTDGAHEASSGLGLGLFIAAQIVGGHGGEIEVESTLEKGTIFRVILPFRH
ncbi:HAMP domain-containing sensor histidine kinase [Pseudomonas cucumis]|uniref:histidine kinase n=1 Tax=Pseudomonas cucumis TaxID=2954082 RepID=A0ABY9F1C4_9PSED|nr:HAMP domain-containing sensor histidine kinase [Pseudomonas cucumis]WLG86617.1 HAMP domain-containing sensor histidine kinase [Pseudomonas cucumis]